MPFLVASVPLAVRFALAMGLNAGLWLGGLSDETRSAHASKIQVIGENVESSTV
jgi:hypothetical protein